MVSYFIRYRGTGPRGLHRVLRDAARRGAKAVSVRSLVLHAPTAWHDPFPVKPSGSLLLAQMTFNSAQALDAALCSAARREAREDFHRFPPFEGEVTHEAMTTKVVF